MVVIIVVNAIIMGKVTKNATEEAILFSQRDHCEFIMGLSASEVAK